MIAEPNTVAPETIQAASCFPPPPTIVPLRTVAMDTFLARPVTLHGLSARDVLGTVGQEHYDATRERRMFIEGALERLEDLRQRLIAKLDALDADPDLEPFLSAAEEWDQRRWGWGTNDDREREDREPNLSATNAMDQRAWSMGGATDLECDRPILSRPWAGQTPTSGRPRHGFPTVALAKTGRTCGYERARPRFRLVAGSARPPDGRLRCRPNWRR